MHISASLPTFDLRVVPARSAATLTLHGELDLANHEQLRADLAAPGLAGIQCVHVDLSSLDFCDVAAFRELVAFAVKVHDDGGRVIGTGAKPTLRKLAAICDPAEQLLFATDRGPDCLALAS